jgi:hypothetical protein
MYVIDKLKVYKTRTFIVTVFHYDIATSVTIITCQIYSITIKLRLFLSDAMLLFIFTVLSTIGVANGVDAPLLLDNVSIRSDLSGRLPNPGTWGDSYSVGNSCYCATTYDHEIGPILVDTPLGVMSIKEVCELLGEGPGIEGRPRYNDIQCGNGPANNAGDEEVCPGRIEHQKNGCRYIGTVYT